MNTFLKIVSVALITFGLMEMASALQSKANYTTATRYNLSGQVTGVIQADPDGSGPLPMPAIRNTYDARGLLIKIEKGYLTSWKNETVEPKNWGAAFTGITLVTTYTYDQYGRQIVQKEENNSDTYALTQTNYDLHNRVRCKTVRMDMNDFNGSLPSACDATLGSFGFDRVTKFEYNENGQVAKEWRAYDTPLQQVYSEYGYDEFFRKESVKDANGNYTFYKYDDLSRLKRWYFPHKTQIGVHSSSDFEEYLYDNNGNKTYFKKRDGKIIRYTYDKLNRIIKKDIPNTTNKDIYYDYDLRGLQTWARFGSHSGSEYARVNYTGFGEVQQRIDRMDGATTTISYRYDKNGNRDRFTTTNGKHFYYYYDQLNRLTNLRENGSSNTILSYVYDNKARIESVSTSGGAVTDLDYDPFSRLDRVEYNFSGSNDDLTLGYSYNPANQLTEQTLSNTDYAYSEQGASQGNYAVNGLNQYTAVDGRSFSYDTNGNLTSDGSTTYTYDAENRLISASGANSADLYYDPLGRLAKVTKNGQSTRFIYDGDYIAEERVNNAVQQRHVFLPGGDQPVVSYSGMSIGSNRTFLHANHQGSIIATSGSNGNVAHINTYSHFGVPSATNDGRFGYTGQVYLPELEMYYYKARMYYPKLGRFLQTDPVGYEDQMNLYAYVGNDPMNNTDPTGKWIKVLADVLKQVAKKKAKEATQEGAKKQAKQKTKKQQKKNNDDGTRRKNRIPDKGEPNKVEENPSGTTRKKYGEDGNVQKEWNKGHGPKAPKNEQNDHIHDYKPNPRNPSGRGERMPGRPPRPQDLHDMELL